MRIDVMRVAGRAITVDVPANSTVEDVLKSRDSGKAFDYPEGSADSYARSQGKSLGELGQVRLNGSNATMGTQVREGDILLVIPKISGAK